MSKNRSPSIKSGLGVHREQLETPCFIVNYIEASQRHREACKCMLLLCGLQFGPRFKYTLHKSSKRSVVGLRCVFQPTKLSAAKMDLTFNEQYEKLVIKNVSLKSFTCLYPSLQLRLTLQFLSCSPQLIKICFLKLDRCMDLC